MVVIINEQSLNVVNEIFLIFLILFIVFGISVLVFGISVLVLRLTILLSDNDSNKDIKYPEDYDDMV